MLNFLKLKTKVSWITKEDISCTTEGDHSHDVDIFYAHLEHKPL